MHFVGRTISHCGDRHIYKGRLVNLNLDSEKIEGSNLSNKLRDLNQLFDVVHLMNISQNTITPLLGTYKFLNTNASGSSDLDQIMDSFAKEKVFPSDRKKFRNYVSSKTLGERIEKSENGYLSDVFGVRQPDGNYILQEIFILAVAGSGDKEYLFCMKDYKKTEMNPYVIDMNGSVRDEYAKLWDNLIWNSSLKFYWKDRKFAYRGVSQAFLDFFGFDSPADCIGFTDRDLNLCVDIDTYEEGEKEIINSGGRMVNVPVECLVNGEPVMTILSEIPIYDDGKLVGTVGFFTAKGEFLGHK